MICDMWREVSEAPYQLKIAKCFCFEVQPDLKLYEVYEQVIFCSRINVWNYVDSA